jgi:endoglucanase
MDVFERAASIGRGINMGNYLEASPNEGDWSGRLLIKQSDFPNIKSHGFDSVRIPVRWSAHAQTSSPYTIQSVFAQRVDEVVGWALDAGLVVILNIHHYEEMMKSGGPAAHRERFLALWRQIAERYASKPGELLFELLNEPCPDGFTESNVSTLNQLYADAIAIIRQTNPHRTIVAGSYWWNSADAMAALVFPAGEKNVIGTFHMYDPFSFTHSGAEWVSPTPTAGATWEGTAQQKQVIDRPLDVAVAWRESRGLPVYLGEFGAYNKAEYASRVRWTTYVVDAAAARNIPWTYWEYSQGFGAYNPSTTEWRTELLNALIH